MAATRGQQPTRAAACAARERRRRRRRARRLARSPATRPSPCCESRSPSRRSPSASTSSSTSWSTGRSISPLDQRHRARLRPGLHVPRRRHRDPRRHDVALSPATAPMSSPAGCGNRDQPADGLGLLRRRPARLRPDARGADTRAARLCLRPSAATAPPLTREREPVPPCRHLLTAHTGLVPKT